MFISRSKDTKYTNTDTNNVKTYQDTTLVAGSAEATNVTDYGRTYAVKDTAENVVTLDELIAQSDIISLHALVTEENTHLLNSERFEKMKDGVILSKKRENSEGIGIKSMRSICDKYKGTLEIKWDNENFIILIILTINN